MKYRINTIYKTQTVSFWTLFGFLMVSPFLVGLYHEYAACGAAICLLAILLLRFKEQVWHMAIYLNCSSVAVLGFTLFSLCCPLWAVDRGMAFLEAVKFLPILIFALLLMQLNREEKQHILWTLPISGVAMTVLSFLFCQLPGISDDFLVDGRLSGFFQYPNTFAIYLLCGLIVLAMGTGSLVWRLLGMAVSVFGIFATGSRTAFVLLVLTLAVLCVIGRDRKVRIGCFCLVAIGVLAAALSGNIKSAARFLTISSSSSTFLGRLLYWKDALSVIAANPFGLGYWGYYFTQGSFQTGVYSVSYVHNEFLQLLLDVGWIPCLLCCAALAASFRRGTAMHRVLLLVIVLHACFDFDLQFLSMCLILLQTMALDSGKKQTITMPFWSRWLPGVAGVLSLYMLLSSVLYYFGWPHAAVTVYPVYTTAKIAMMTEAEDANQGAQIAEQVLQGNQYVSLAYHVKAAAAFSSGDFTTMIEQEQKAIETNRYAQEEYLDYFSMLAVGIELYTQNGDASSAAFCAERLQEIPKRMAEVLAETDPLAWKIQDQPKLELPKEYQDYLQKLQTIGN